MKRRKLYIVIFALILSIVFIQSQCHAQNMLRKLGRGAANVVTSPLEIPKSIQKVLYDDGPVAGVTYGLVEGGYKGLLRAVVGVYEVFTFPIPFPADYEPIVVPEFLFQPDGAYSF